MAFLDDLAAKLDSAGVTGGATGWSALKSFLANDPDKVICLLETGGNPSEQGEIGYDHPTFQALVRGVAFGYAAARTKADAVVSALNDATISGCTYVFVRHAPLPIGLDANNRPLISLNFDAMKVRT